MTTEMRSIASTEKVAIIMRGLPGSGKSYWAARFIESQGIEQAVRIKQHGYFSTDDYFVQDGEYRFNAKRLPEYHQRNLARFISALSTSEPVVICDNTNVCHWEYLAYKTAAEGFGYQVRMVLVGDPKSSKHQALCAKRNSHNVPFASIRKMGQMFELD
ncbi:AAA family ATPase [Shewanella maritima]|nr:AAA family ATPase [Shewanella maritima]